jgi:hypothetical protein
MACLGVHFAITADLAARLSRDWPVSNSDAVARLEDLGRQFHALHAEAWVANRHSGTFGGNSPSP